MLKFRNKSLILKADSELLQRTLTIIITFFFLAEKIKLNISCEFSAMQSSHMMKTKKSMKTGLNISSHMKYMKCQGLFSWIFFFDK